MNALVFRVEGTRVVGLMSFEGAVVRVLGFWGFAAFGVLRPGFVRVWAYWAYHCMLLLGFWVYAGLVMLKPDPLHPQKSDWQTDLAAGLWQQRTSTL